MKLTPLILGSGRSGDAVAKSLAILNIMRPELSLESPVYLPRNASLADEKKKYEHPILCITNPHGLHVKAILEADKAGYAGLICEKPACVNLEEVEALRKVKIPTAILHVYRQTWGIQTLKKMILEKQFGEIITIEGRYWQSSTAERALQPTSSKGWKDDTALSGEYDVYLDIGTHWVDTANFLLGEEPKKISGWRSFANATSAHRDSHVQLILDYPSSRGFASISKTVHGSTNHFEVNVIGTKLSGTWKFLEADEILIGEGKERRVISRKQTDFGSKQPPFHGMGWLEGYIEISSQLIDHVLGEKDTQYPNLSTNLITLEKMLKAEWN